ncbi:MAG: hypothetical protein DHS20C05_03480 [Hyphococcus sp.]|nr:MAG: hypothetical protein DHS20C05_03480 [Marinicaulis sp.]
MTQSIDQSDDLSKSDRSYLLGVGYMVAYWNNAENAMRALVSKLLKLNAQQESLLLRHIGNQSLCEVAGESATQWIADENLLDLILHNLKAFDICRVNRNAVIHSAFVYPSSDSDDEQGLLITPPDRNRKKERVTRTQQSELSRIGQDCSDLATFTVRLESFVDLYANFGEQFLVDPFSDHTQELPAKPPLPRLIFDNQQNSQTRIPPPQS